MSVRRLLILAWAVCLGGLAAPAAAGDQPLPVLVTILPHASLVEALAPGAVTVDVIVAPGESPASFDPSARRLAELARARLWLTTGAPLEPALRPRLQALAPDLDIVDTHAGLPRLAIDDHGHDHGHDHGDTDPHVWLGVRDTAAQVDVMAAALARLLPHRADAIEAARADLAADLAALDRDLAALLAPVRGATMFVFHPAFAYFTHDYGLVQQAIERGGMAPSPRHLAQLMRSVREQGARTVFLQPQYSDQVVRTVAREAGLDVVVLDPLARDHLANLRRLGEALAAGLEARP